MSPHGLVILQVWPGAPQDCFGGSASHFHDNKGFVWGGFSFAFFIFILSQVHSGVFKVCDHVIVSITGTEMRNQLPSIKPDIKKICKIVKIMPFLSLNFCFRK